MSTTIRPYCKHVPHTNWRYPHSCGDCGAYVESWPAPEPTSRPRNLAFERESLEHAARGITDADSLWDRMLFRSTELCGEYVAKPSEVALDRDRPREVREEAEDLLNHANWWLEVNAEHPKALLRAESLKWMCMVYQAWLDDDD